MSMMAMMVEQTTRLVTINWHPTADLADFFFEVKVKILPVPPKTSNSWQT
jgi:hypothetical protein